MFKSEHHNTESIIICHTKKPELKCMYLSLDKPTIPMLYFVISAKVNKI